MAKVAIIGAGIIGVCVAHFLRKGNHEVIIFDHNDPGTQTSYGNAGIFANHDCVFANSPRIWKELPRMLFSKNSLLSADWYYVLTHLPWFLRFLGNCTKSKVEHIARSLSNFSFHAELAYEEIFNEVDVSEYVVKKDSLYLYATKDSFERAQFIFNLRKKNNIPFEFIDKDDIASMEPSLAPVYYRGVLFKEEGYTRSSIKITQKIFDNFINNGGQFIKKKVDSIDKSGKLLFLRSGESSFQVDKVVIACGAWSNELANKIGDNFPLDTERGYHVLFESDKELISRSVGWASAGFYMTPMEDGIRAAGTVEIAGLKKPMNHQRLAMIEATARKILPQLGKVKSQWMGFRPTLSDSLPVIGESQKCKNVFYAFGHQHLGLSLGAVTGKSITSLIDNKPSNINIKPLSPLRF